MIIGRVLCCSKSFTRELVHSCAMPSNLLHHINDDIDHLPTTINGFILANTPLPSTIKIGNMMILSPGIFVLEQYARMGIINHYDVIRRSIRDRYDFLFRIYLEYAGYTDGQRDCITSLAIHSRCHKIFDILNSHPNTTYTTNHLINAYRCVNKRAASLIPLSNKFIGEIRENTIIPLSISNGWITNLLSIITRKDFDPKSTGFKSAMLFTKFNSIKSSNMIQFIVSHPIINKSSMICYTLEAAVHIGNSQLVQWLLNNIPEDVFVSVSIHSCLAAAISKNRVDIIKIILDHSRTHDEDFSNYRVDIMKVAIEYFSIKTIKYLLHNKRIMNGSRIKCKGYGKNECIRTINAILSAN